jgi:hypothetical protein
MGDPEQFRDCWRETLKKEAARSLAMVLLFYFSNRAAGQSMILLLRTVPAKLMEIAPAVSKLIH